jgi:signal transduction histidine kinase
LPSLFDGRSPGVVLEVPTDFPRIWPDETKVRTVLLNLIENALKYSRDQSLPVSISFKSQPTQVVIRDHGIGIAPEELPWIFEPFYRTDKSRNGGSGGYGLGLSLCREIMKAHAAGSIFETIRTAALKSP